MIIFILPANAILIKDIIEYFTWKRMKIMDSSYTTVKQRMNLQTTRGEKNTQLTVVMTTVLKITM